MIKSFGNLHVGDTIFRLNKKTLELNAYKITKTPSERQKNKCEDLISYLFYGFIRRHKCYLYICITVLII